MRKIKMMLVSCLIVLWMSFCCIGCKDSAPSDKLIKTNLPSELVNVSYDEVTYTPEVKDFKISRRQTNEKEDIADCIIRFENENFTRTVYATITCNYYDQGGWQVDSWKPYQDEEFEPKVNPSVDKMKSEIIKLGYQNVEYTSEKITNEEGDYVYQCIFNINDKYTYLSYEGTAVVTATLQNTSDDGSYNKIYEWTYDASQKDVKRNWDVLGTWNVKQDETKYDNPDYFDLTITALTQGKIGSSKAITGSGTYHTYTRSILVGQSGYSSGKFEKGIYTESGQGPKDHELVISVGYHNNSVNAYFTKDKVEFKLPGYTSDFTSVERS